MTRTPTPLLPDRAVRRLAAFTAGATLLLIAMGGAVRATNSGLACPDWPACYGQWVPPADLNIWLEHSHRLWAGVVAMSVLTLIVLTSRRRHAARWPWRAAVTVGVLILVQSGLGAAVVLGKLRAELVTAHLAMSLLVVGLLIVISRRHAGNDPIPPRRTPLRRAATLVAAATFVQAALGSHATGHAAAWVFDAFPIWRATDAWSGSTGQLLHVAHRGGGYLVALAVLALGIAAHRRPAPAATRRLARLAMGLVVAQVGLGIANVLTNATEWSAIAHLTVASWLWATLVALATPATPTATAVELSPVALEEVVA